MLSALVAVSAAGITGDAGATPAPSAPILLAAQHKSMGTNNKKNQDKKHRPQSKNQGKKEKNLSGGSGVAY